MLASRSCRLACGLLVATATSCGKLSDLGVEYEECIPAAYPYSERFEGDTQTLTDRCWQTNAGTDDAIFLVVDGDYVIRPRSNAVWTDEKQAPSATLRMQGDFLFVTRAEVLSTFSADHCGLTPTDTAGIVAYEAKTKSWSTLTVRPFLEAPGVQCEDNAKRPPRATVEIKDFGLVGEDSLLNGVGADGEGDIALCRQGKQLAYFYRDFDEPDVDAQWKLLGQRTVSANELEVGLTTTGQDVRGIEGHFTWVLIPYQGQGEGCSETLAKLKLPKDG